MSKNDPTISAAMQKTVRLNHASRDVVSSFMQVSLKDARTDAHVRKKIDFFRKNYPKLERMSDHDSLQYKHLSQICSLLARQILQEVQSKSNSQTRH
jgi:hypothetical protein